jgi:uncharacterized protein
VPALLGRLGALRGEDHVVEAPDGVRLATTVHRPAGPGRHPAVLIRTPYGTSGLTGTPITAMATLLAATGYAVVVQDVRGRGRSGGDFLPGVDDAADGARTAEWVHDQPWCDGRIGAWGVSYLGATALAVATEVPELVGAVAVGATSARLALPDERGVHHLDTSLRWLVSLQVMESGGSVLRRTRQLSAARSADPALHAAMRHLPLADLDLRVLGRRSAAWQAWVAEPDPSAPRWRPADRRPHLHRLGPTAHTAGWSDVFVDHQLDDVEAAAAPPDLVVGPWTHLDPRLQMASLRQAATHFDRHLRGLDRPGDPRPRLWLGGAGRWWHPPAWPPPTRVQEWLVAGEALQRRDAVTATPLVIPFDPADPPPSLGGRSLSLQAGRVDCAPLERRADVHVATSPPLRAGVALVGRAELRTTVVADTGMADLWVRLAEVDAGGRSTSVADGFARVRDARDGAPAVVVLHPVAHRFAEGSRLRLLIAGGSFPAFDRNPGDGVGSPHATALRPTTARLPDGASLRLPALV